MSKSILVIDTPNSCDECPLFSAAYSDMKCRGNGMDIDYPYPNDKVQEWCPLKPLPEKTNPPAQYPYLHRLIADGWNACIDAILKGAENNE